MQVKAEARYVRVSAQKARLVVDLIRGRKAGEAITILRTTNKRISPAVEKVLRSAIANCQNVKSGTGTETSVDAEKLVVKTIFADEGRDLKRVRPRARGSADRIVKRHSHVTVVVSDEAS